MTKPPESAIQPITATVAANALTVTLNPTTLDFRSATLGSGTVVSRLVSSAITVTVSSGSTLGTVSGEKSRIVVLAIDNAGTVELAVVNIAGNIDLTETGLISTTAEGGGGAADSSSTVYATATRSNLAYRVVGYVESTQATAGTWATAPSTIQGCGGQALTAMSSMGYGQTYQSVTRTSGTTYYNTTGKPITLVVSPAISSNTTVTVNGVALTTTASSVGQIYNFSYIIPVGASYILTVSSGSATTFELR
jgi:hypothetical protein